VKIAAESALREIISRTPIQAAMSDKRAQIADEPASCCSACWIKSTPASWSRSAAAACRPAAQVIDAFNDVQRAAQIRSALAMRPRPTPMTCCRARARRRPDHAGGECLQGSGDQPGCGRGQPLSIDLQELCGIQGGDAWRLYLESMDEVLKKASKVIIDSSGKGMSGWFRICRCPTRRDREEVRCTERCARSRLSMNQAQP